MVVDDIKQLSMEYLMDSPLVSEFQKAISTFEKAQLTLYNMVSAGNESMLMQLRTGTVLTMAVINKVAGGTSVKDFTDRDWADIANAVADYGINIDGQEYSILVFHTYADYIDVSAEVISVYSSVEEVDNIHSLSTEIRDKTELLKSGSISEVNYIEDCLWISLEAMIKLLSLYTTRFLSPELKMFASGLTSYGFEYARLKLYKREQELLTYYLDCQKEIDEQLTLQYESFLADLKEQTDKFDLLVENAFDKDIRNMLLGSVELANSVGVRNEDILDSIDKIDDFFS